MESRGTSSAASAVIRLHPIRVLVLGADSPYRDRVARVVGDLGPISFALTALRQCDEAADVLALVDHERPNVVVLDATGCETAAERVVRALAEAMPRVGSVVVCEHSTTAARRLGALPKWGWTQDLRTAVERAYLDATHRGPGIRPAGPPRVAGPLSGWDEGVPTHPERSA